MTDFDLTVNRLGTNSIKWDEIKDMYHEEDLLPLWIADMDFKAPDAVIEAFQTIVNHGVFGYTAEPDSLYQALIDWENQQHQVKFEKAEVLLFASVLGAITTALQALTKTNDAVLIHDPVYPPFADIVKRNKRKLIRSRLIEEDSLFKMDWADMEEKFKQHQVKVFILCNPHNPGGRVWSKEELATLGELCKKYKVLVFSDEIHQDLIFNEKAGTSFYNAGDFADFTIKFTSITKTFNLAGIKTAVTLVKNETLRTKITKMQLINFQQEVNLFGLAGMEATYRSGLPWLKNLLTYLADNVAFTVNYLAEQLPQVKVMQPEATYLLWLDFSAFGLTDEALEDKLIHQGKIVLNSGISYGDAGTQHMRLNVACSRETLVKGLERMVKTFA